MKEELKKHIEEAMQGMLSRFYIALRTSPVDIEDIEGKAKEASDYLQDLFGDAFGDAIFKAIRQDNKEAYAENREYEKDNSTHHTGNL